MYSVDTCGVCVHERKCAYEPPCCDCSVLRSTKKVSYFEKVVVKECEETGKSCEYGCCEDCV